MVKCNSASLAAITISIALIIGLTFSYSFFFPKEDDTFFTRPKSEPQAPQLYSVHIVSWNVGGNSPNQKMLHLLGINDTFSPDFVVVGIQETIVAKFALKFLTHKSKWPDAIDLELQPYGYQKVGLAQNKAMDLMVYVKVEHAKKLEQFETNIKNTNYLAIKGGISIRFDLNWKKIAFTNSHLPAGDQENSEREKQYNEIKDKSFIHSGYLNNHDYHFWFGDLNFRLQHESPEYALKVINSIKESTDPELRKKDLEILLHKDQLKISQKMGRAFQEYVEPEINFLPTYKFFEYSYDYDLARQPSYCDRILTKKLEQPNINLEITNVFYEPKFQFTMSDHRPITALYYIKA